MTKKRRKKWRAPNNPTATAKQVWKAVYDEPWPKGWRVEWAGFMRGALGLTIYGERRILLSWADAQNRRGGKAIPNAWSSACRLLYSGDPELGEFYITSGRLPQRSQPRTGQVLRTLIHEFTHLRNRNLRHGKEFERLVEWGWNRLRA